MNVCQDSRDKFLYASPPEWFSQREAPRDVRADCIRNCQRQLLPELNREPVLRVIRIDFGHRATLRQPVIPVERNRL